MGINPDVRKLIGVYTADFGFFHDVRETLKARGIPFVGLSIGEEVPDDVGVILTSPKEMGDLDFEPKVASKSIEEAIGRAICALTGKTEFDWLTIGVDPGPKPGIAAVGDGEVLETLFAESPEQVAELVSELVRVYAHQNSRIRIGHGDPLNRNRIINSLLDEDYFVEMVDEKGTTIRTENPDLEAAKKIAATRGNPIRERLSIIPTARQLKEIQRQSRIASDNRITITTDLAREVAVGKITLTEALHRQERQKKA
ncbi:MAG: hypothetical protein ACE5IO_02485 [Thermoplasmata archaeon]